MEAASNSRGLISAAIYGVPVRVGEEIAITGHSPATRRSFRHVYRVAQRIISVYAAVRMWLIKSGELPAHKAVEIYQSSPSDKTAGGS